MISWAHIDSHRYELAVQALLREIHPDLASIDGAGGDGGRDAQRAEVSGTGVVFEMKYFAQRLTSSQRRQITRSRDTARKLERVERWVLIVPLNRTPAELEWFERLAADCPEIVHEWRGRDWLDGQFAKRPDLARYIEGDSASLVRQAKAAQEEQSILLGGASDLVNRQQRIRESVEVASTPQWTLDWQSDANGTRVWLRERYPGASVDDPVALLPDVQFDRENEDAAETERKYVNAVEYGGSVTLKAPYLKGVRVEASKEVLDLMAVEPYTFGGEIEVSTLRENIDPARVFRLEAYSSAGVTASSVDLVFTQRTRGRRGVSLIGHDLSRILTLTVRLDDPEDDGTVAVALDFSVKPIAGLSVDSVEPILAVLADGKRFGGLGLRIDGQRQIESQLGDNFEMPVLEALPLVSALKRLQRIAPRDLNVPEELSASDARELIWLAKALDAERVETSYVNFKAGVLPDKVKEFVGQFRAPEHQLIARHDNIRILHEGVEFDYGPAAYHAPRIALVNADELIGWRPSDGETGGPIARFKAVDEPIYFIGGDAARSLMRAT